MKGREMILAAVISVVAICTVNAQTKDGPDGKFAGEGRYIKMKECCPSLPPLVPEGSYENCTAPQCKVQCAFENNKFLSLVGDKKKINLTAYNEYLDRLAVGNWTDPIAKAKENCTTAEPAVELRGKCTSGSREVFHCVKRSLVARCPTTLSDSCRRTVERMNSGGRKGAFISRMTGGLKWKGKGAASNATGNATSIATGNTTDITTTAASSSSVGGGVSVDTMMSGDSSTATSIM